MCICKYMCWSDKWRATYAEERKTGQLTRPDINIGRQGYLFFQVSFYSLSDTSQLRIHI